MKSQRPARSSVAAGLLQPAQHPKNSETARPPIVGVPSGARRGGGNEDTHAKLSGPFDSTVRELVGEELRFPADRAATHDPGLALSLSPQISGSRALICRCAKSWVLEEGTLHRSARPSLRVSRVNGTSSAQSRAVTVPRRCPTLSSAVTTFVVEPSPSISDVTESPALSQLQPSRRLGSLRGPAVSTIVPEGVPM